MSTPYTVTGPLVYSGGVDFTGPSCPVTNLVTTTLGDTLYCSNGTTKLLSRLGIGAPGDVYTVSGGGIPSWATPAPGGGTVTTVSVVSANGLAGTVANPTTTPAITLSTTVTSNVLKGNGTAITASVLGTDNGTVATGGTGLTSTTAYAPLCGGTTTTAALQPVASGTAGYALTYVSAAALPTWSNIGLWTTMRSTAYTNATTTLSNISGLSFLGVANTVYEISALIMASMSAVVVGCSFAIQQSGGSGGTLFCNANFNGTGSATTQVSNSGTGFGTAAGTVFVTASSGQGIIRIVAVCYAGTTGAPTLTIQAKAGGVGTVTVRADSYMKVRVMA